MNPFSSCLVQPGSIPYAFVDGGSLQTIVEGFHAHRRTGAIIGPHGSGKSTLLHSLIPHLGSLDRYCDVRSPLQSCMPRRRASPRQNQTDDRTEQSSRREKIRWFRMSSQGRAIRTILSDRRQWDASTTLVIDGYEQIHIVGKLWLNGMRRVQKWGLLVTAHRPLTNIPTLWLTNVTPSSAAYVVHQLLPADQAGQFMQAARWFEIRKRWPDNLRETLFELYDWVEDQKAEISTSPNLAPFDHRELGPHRHMIADFDRRIDR